MRNYNLVESIIEETYEIEKKTVKSFFSSKIVETEVLSEKKKEIYKDGDIISYERIYKNVFNEFERELGVKKYAPNGEFCWEFQVKRENGDMLEETLQKFNKNGDCYYENKTKWNYLSNKEYYNKDYIYTNYKLTYDSNGLLINEKALETRRCSNSNYYNVDDKLIYDKSYEYNLDRTIKRCISEWSYNSKREIIEYSYDSRKNISEKRNSMNDKKETITKYERNSYGDIVKKIVKENGSERIISYENQYDSNGFILESRVFSRNKSNFYWRYIVNYK